MTQFKEYKSDGEFVLDPDGNVRYDGLSPRAADIIAELLTYQSILEADKSELVEALRGVVCVGYLESKGTFASQDYVSKSAIAKVRAALAKHDTPAPPVEPAGTHRPAKA